MMKFLTLALVVITVTGLAGCSETSNSGGGGVSLTQNPSCSSSAPSSAEKTCLAAVSKQTNNGDVTVLSSEFSQAGTSVKIGVGPQRAQWSCTAYSDGSTSNIQSLTNEGSL